MVRRLSPLLVIALALALPSAASARTLSSTAAYNVASVVAQRWADNVSWAYYYDDPSDCSRASFHEIDCTIAIENEAQTFTCWRGIDVLSHYFSSRLTYRLQPAQCSPE
jgi:hypothetical protein